VILQSPQSGSGLQVPCQSRVVVAGDNSTRQHNRKLPHKSLNRALIVEEQSPLRCHISPKKHSPSCRWRDQVLHGLDAPPGTFHQEVRVRQQGTDTNSCACHTLDGMNSKAEWLPPPGGRLLILLDLHCMHVSIQTCRLPWNKSLGTGGVSQEQPRDDHLRIQGVARGTYEPTSARFQEFARGRLGVFSNRLHVAAASTRGRYRQGPHL